MTQCPKFGLRMIGKAWKWMIHSWRHRKFKGPHIGARLTWRANQWLQGGLFPNPRLLSAKIDDEQWKKEKRVVKIEMTRFPLRLPLRHFSFRQFSISKCSFGRIRELNDFDAFFKWTSEEKILVYFYAEWCNLRGFQKFEEVEQQL